MGNTIGRHWFGRRGLGACAAFGLVACQDRALPVVSVDAAADVDAAPIVAGPRLPLVPVGLEAIRQWDRLPYLRIGTRTVMRSTFDRKGGNEAADARHFVRRADDGTFVAMDVGGPGQLVFVRTNHWHGSPWHYVVDGRDTVVSESSTTDPVHPVPGSTFQPPALFPSPLAVTWSTTHGADLSWVPVPFEDSLEIRYGRTFYGTGYFIVNLFAPGDDHIVPASRSWAPPDPDVLALLDRAGEDIAPAGAASEGTLTLAAAQVRPLPTLTGPATLRVLELEVPASAALALEQARLRIRWDGRAQPSVDVPVPLFFGTGTLFNRQAHPYLVRSLLQHVRFDGDPSTGRINLASYFPMPFTASATIELQAGATPLPAVTWRLRTVPFTDAPSDVGSFHATFTDDPTPVAGQDLVVLDTAGAEGSNSWCGTFVGMSWTFSDRAVLRTLEGDPRFFFDDSASPQAQGTGTEEWGGGGDYWGGKTMTLPFVGHPVGAPSEAESLDPRDLIESAYRLLVSDAMPFGRRARIQLEHGGTDESVEHYRSVAYWYGQPGACLVPTDQLHVSDSADERAHHYQSPQASSVDTLSSRYELGVDHLGTVELQAASTDTGRHTIGSTTVRFAIDPANVGVLLRRKLDQRFADQRALVEVADDRPDAPFVRAGVWSTPGSDVVVFIPALPATPGAPPEELSSPAPEIETSNRRWKEDELLLPRALTEGRAAIRVRLTFQPRNLPPLPGMVGPQAWSEYRYWAYSWRFPAVPPTP